MKTKNQFSLRPKKFKILNKMRENQMQEHIKRSPSLIKHPSNAGVAQLCKLLKVNSALVQYQKFPALTPSFHNNSLQFTA